MAKPDIVISESETTAIGRIDVRESDEGPPKVRMDPSGTGRLTVGAESVARDTETGRSDTDDGAWDIKLAPKWATIDLGGGAGSNSDGDLKLYDNPEGETSKPRVHLSAEPGGKQSARVHLNGEGYLSLGGSGKDGRISLMKANGDLNAFIDIGDRARLSLAGEESGGVIGLYGPDDNDLDGLPALGLSAEGPDAIEADASIIAAGGLFLQFVQAMQGNRVFLLGSNEGEDAQPARIILSDQGSDNPDQTIRKTADGVVVTDENGDPAMEIAEDGTVSVTGGSVGEL